MDTSTSSPSPLNVRDTIKLHTSTLSALLVGACQIHAVYLCEGVCITPLYGPAAVAWFKGLVSIATKSAMYLVRTWSARSWNTFSNSACTTLCDGHVWHFYALCQASWANQTAIETAVTDGQQSDPCTAASTRYLVKTLQRLPSPKQPINARLQRTASRPPV